MRAQGDSTKHGKPQRWRRVRSQRDAREGQARPCGVAERSVVPQKSGNADGGKGPQFKDSARRSESQEIGDESNPSGKGSEVADGVTRQSEEIAWLSVLCLVRQLRRCRLVSLENLGKSLVFWGFLASEHSRGKRPKTPISDPLRVSLTPVFEQFGNDARSRGSGFATSCRKRLFWRTRTPPACVFVAGTGGRGGVGSRPAHDRRKSAPKTHLSWSSAPQGGLPPNRTSPNSHSGAKHRT